VHVGCDHPAGTPRIISTKRDALAIDADGDGRVSPGDTLRYTIVITNAGTGAGEFALLNDIADPNVTLVAGSVTTTQGTVTVGNDAGMTEISVDIGLITPGSVIVVTFDVGQ